MTSITYVMYVVLLKNLGLFARNVVWNPEILTISVQTAEGI